MFQNVLESWDLASLNTEIVIHGSHNQVDKSTCVDTINDSDEIEIKPVFIIFVFMICTYTQCLSFFILYLCIW